MKKYKDYKLSVSLSKEAFDNIEIFLFAVEHKYYVGVINQLIYKEPVGFSHIASQLAPLFFLSDMDNLIS